MLALIPVFHILLNRTEIESGMSFPWTIAARKTSTMHSKRMSHVSCCPISMYPIDWASWSNTARELQYLVSLIQHFMGFRCLTQPEQGTSYHGLSLKVVNFVVCPPNNPHDKNSASVPAMFYITKIGMSASMNTLLSVFARSSECDGG